MGGEIQLEAVKYSIVIPIYNEEESFPALVKRLREVMDQLDGPAEVVLVDDGSRDRSYELMAAVNREDPRFKVLQLSRNFGHQIAITAGMDVAAGQAVIVMDADLQDPPEVILQMAARWQEGYEVVYAVREHREGETVFKRRTATIFYGIQRRLAEIDQPVEVGDFRLVDRKALDAFLQMRERNRYVRGMFSWVGFRQTAVPYTRASREAGQSKYPFRKMVRLALDGFVGFSTAPLRFALTLGLVMAALSVAYGIVLIALKLAGLAFQPGYASLLVAITFLSGVQLTVIGMVGQYVARIYDEARARPLYLVREARGFTSGGHANGGTDAEALWPAASPDSLIRGQRVPPLPPTT
ncbi:MAG TPA: glycosyltransferase family 2 protein [Streptosporangiaceae bacterium]|nr:glycosyltransferase family 2 protein [Streptosporangiaceae bacterium]